MLDSFQQTHGDIARDAQNARRETQGAQLQDQSRVRSQTLDSISSEQSDEPGFMQNHAQIAVALQGYRNQQQQEAEADNLRGNNGYFSRAQALDSGHQIYMHKGDNRGFTVAGGRDREVAKDMRSDEPVSTFQALKKEEFQRGHDAIAKFASLSHQEREAQLGELHNLVESQKQNLRDTYANDGLGDRMIDQSSRRAAEMVQAEASDDYRMSFKYNMEAVLETHAVDSDDPERIPVKGTGFDEVDATSLAFNRMKGRQVAINTALSNSSQDESLRDHLNAAQSLLTQSSSLERVFTGGVAGSHNNSEKAFTSHPTDSENRVSVGDGASGYSHRARGEYVQNIEDRANQENPNMSLAMRQAVRLDAGHTATQNSSSSPSTDHTNTKILNNANSGSDHKRAAIMTSRQASKNSQINLQRQIDSMNNPERPVTRQRAPSETRFTIPSR